MQTSWRAKATFECISIWHDAVRKQSTCDGDRNVDGGNKKCNFKWVP